MQATLTRLSYSPTHTPGVLVIRDGNEVWKFATIEPPWADNERSISCIPEGTYGLAPLKKSNSGKYKNVFWVHQVPNREGILIHNGNLRKHSRGCIILGMEHGKLAGQEAVLASRTACAKLWELQPDRLVVKSGDPTPKIAPAEDQRSKVGFFTKLWNFITSWQKRI